MPTSRDLPSSHPPRVSSAVRRRARSARRTRLVAGAVAGALALLTGLTTAGPAIGDDLDDQQAALEQQQSANEQAKADAEAALEGLSEQYAQGAQELLAVQQQLPGAQQALADAEDALAGFEREADLIASRLQDAEDQESTLSATIDEDSGRKDELRSQIAQLARQAYQGGNSTLSGLDLVTGAESVEQFTQEYSAMSSAQRAQEQVLRELTDIDTANRQAQARLAAVRDRITQLKAEADEKVAQAEQARQDAAARKTELDNLVAEQQAKQADLDRQKADVQAEVDELDSNASALESELAEIAKQKQAAAAAAAAAAGEPAPVAGPVTGALFGNPTSINPIYVTSEYGNRLHPILGYYRLHAGIDLRTYCGTPIYAAKDGTVQWAQYRNGFGNQVMIDHGLYNGSSLMTSYNHMTSFKVSGGQSVSQGQLLGYSGNTGTSAACHLHFEVYVNGATVNPRPLLGL